MRLRNGTNTISDGRFEAAKSALREEQWYDQERASAGRTEELPYQMSTRHIREWVDLHEDRKRLSVQEWLKRYPDSPDIKQRESYWASEISAGKALREQRPQRQEQAQKPRQQQM